jgi:type I restriction-modification system DNA methylase subunit
MTNFSSMAAFLWSVADLLRGDFKQSQYGRVILPFTVLRRLECVLAPTKQAVLDKLPVVEKLDENAADAILRHASGQHFYNTSPLDLSKLGKHSHDLILNVTFAHSAMTRVRSSNTLNSMSLYSSLMMPIYSTK